MSSILWWTDQGKFHFRFLLRAAAKFLWNPPEISLSTRVANIDTPNRLLLTHSLTLRIYWPRRTFFSCQVSALIVLSGIGNQKDLQRFRSQVYDLLHRILCQFSFFHFRGFRRRRCYGSSPQTLQRFTSTSVSAKKNKDRNKFRIAQKS